MSIFVVDEKICRKMVEQGVWIIFAGKIFYI